MMWMMWMLYGPFRGRLLERIEPEPHLDEAMLEWTFNGLGFAKST